MSNFWDSIPSPNQKHKKSDKKLVENKKASTRRYKRNEIIRDSNLWPEDLIDDLDKVTPKKKKEPPKPVQFVPLISKKHKGEKTDTRHITTGSEMEPADMLNSEGEREFRISNPEGGDQEIEPEDDDDCFFCEYYSRSNEIENDNLNEIKLMLLMIESMFAKNNMNVEQIGAIVEKYYYDAIYKPRVTAGHTNVPLLKKRHVVRHIEKHININPTIFLHNTFQKLEKLANKLIEKLFILGDNNEELPVERNINCFLKTIDMQFRIHKFDVSESPFFSGDGFAYTLNEKGMFLNSGVSVTDEHKKVVNKWGEEPYKPLYKEK